MTVRLLPASGRVPKPWKNGGGITTDVFVWPENAGVDDFLARVSIAEVAEDGPFSRFPAIDRTTAILAGGGFDLRFEQVTTHRLTQDAAPLVYDGDVPAQSTLLAGPTTDLNAMSRRGHAAHRMTRYDAVSAAQFISKSDITVLLVTRGEITLSVGAKPQALRPYDAIALFGAEILTVAAANAATAYVIEFSLTQA